MGIAEDQYGSGLVPRCGDRAFPQFERGHHPTLQDYVDQRFRITRMFKIILRPRHRDWPQLSQFRIEMQRSPRLRRNKDIIGVVFARTTACRPNVPKTRTGTMARVLFKLDLIQDIVYTQAKDEVTGSRKKDNTRKRQREMKSLTNTSVSQPTAALPTQGTPA